MRGGLQGEHTVESWRGSWSNAEYAETQGKTEDEYRRRDKEHRQTHTNTRDQQREHKPRNPAFKTPKYK